MSKPTKLAVVYRPIADLVPYARNARTHSDEQVAQIVASIKAFGFTNPVLIAENNEIIAGHGRVLAAELLELKEVPTILLAKLSPAQAKAYRLADNKLALNSGWDLKLLSLELQDLDTGEVPLVLTGFGADELEDLMTWSPTERDGHSDPDEVPEAPEHAISKAGDLWHMGRHRLLCGDSFDHADLKRLMGTSKASMVLTDPPYAIYGSSTGIAADIADDKMVRPFFEKLGQVIADNLQEFGHAYVHCDWRSYATLWHGLKSARLSPKNCIVWDKGSAGLGNSYANTHEFVAFFALLPKQKAMTSGNKRGQRPVHKANLFRTNRVTGKERQHNAAKPVDLLGFLIENSSDVGDLVVDLFAGSGSTLVAATKRERSCYSMEMEPRFVDVAVKRWQTFTQEKAKLDTGETFEDVAAQRLTPTPGK